MKHWLLLLLSLVVTSAVGATYSVSIGDDCDSFSPAGCFTPGQLTIHVGDTVEFGSYLDVIVTGPHNVVADDGSFRCAVGCDGEGGSRQPVSVDFPCNASGVCNFADRAYVRFTRQFNVPGVVNYHDEAGGAPGVIIVAPLPIGAGHTGSWFDPSQSGHGFALEVLTGEPMRLLAYWFTFAPQGEQSWIAALGPIDGNRAVLDGVQTVGAGARFPPNFDAANAHQNSWGTLTFPFTDCSHGHVDWVSSAPGYGSGGTDLTRLTLPAELSCP